MKLHKGEVITLVFVLLSFALAFLIYPHLPDKIVSHWDAQGQANGYMDKFWGTLLFPIILLGMYLLFLLIPRVDPKKENIVRFRKYFDWFIITFFLFMYYVYAITLVWNLGYRFDFVRFMIPGIAVLFYAISIVLSHSEMNWSVGIRTPWTLSSPEVWRKTHELGGKLFRWCALVALAGVIFPDLAIWLVLLPILAVTVWTIVYSYLEYRREKV